MQRGRKLQKLTFRYKHELRQTCICIGSDEHRIRLRVFGPLMNVTPEQMDAAWAEAFDMLARVAGHLSPGGCVLLGSSESTLGLGEALVPDPVNRGLYVRPQRAPVDFRRQPG